MNLILQVMKKVIFSFSPERNLVEGFFKWDFKIGTARENLMQVCFSSLASWFLIVLMFLLTFDPTKQLWSMAKLFSNESSILFYLLDGHLGPMLVVFGVTFLLEWLLRFESLFILLIAYFLNRGELHINLATAGFFGIWLSRICYMWWLVVDSESETRLVWNRVHQLQFLSWIITLGFGLAYLDFLQVNYIFQENFGFTRLYFLILLTGIFHIFNQILLSLWGHFYFFKKKDPSYLPVSYSSALWILRLSLPKTLIYKLKKEIEAQIERHQTHLKKIAELKLENSKVTNFSVETTIHKELEYLKEANLRLSQA